MNAKAQKALSQIRKMLPRTEANGATTSEVDAAATQIGRLIMKFPGLLIGSTHTETERPKYHQQQAPPNTKTPEDAVVFPHNGVIGESEKSILVVIRGIKCWLLKDHIKYDHNTVAIARWLAIAKGLL